MEGTDIARAYHLVSLTIYQRHAKLGTMVGMQQGVAFNRVGQRTLHLSIVIVVHPTAAFGQHLVSDSHTLVNDRCEIVCQNSFVCAISFFLAKVCKRTNVIMVVGADVQPEQHQSA